MEGESVRRLEGNPFPILKELLRSYRLPADPSLPPFLGGAVGYFGYDLGRVLEKIPSRSIDDLNLPDCYLCFYDNVLIYDHEREELYLSSLELPGERKEARKARLCQRERLEQIASGKEVLSETSLSDFSRQVHMESNFTADGYMEAVRRAKEYIVAGDIYQVNLSQRFTAELPVPPFQLYEKLRRINPAPFASFLNFGEVTIVSASPERFLVISDGRVETRPIKGTRPRGMDPVEDRRLEEELLSSEKDRAELVMIVDLERNDLGKVCEYGSVQVSEPVVLEAYPTVFHTVSTVEGKLHRDKDAIDCLKASFPGGSITGAPKIRAMEIIEELEPTRRGIYTGSIGYIGFDGRMDVNIVIRTLVIKEEKVYLHVGGGIVADSDPEKEYEETLHKGRALIETVTSESVATHAVF